MAFKTIVFIVACSSVVFADLIRECPPQESIACQCHSIETFYPDYVNWGSDIGCNRIRSLKDFQDVLKPLKGYKIFTLAVLTMNTSMLSTDSFQGLHIRKLWLSDVRADDVSLGHSHFVGLENSLEELEVKLVPDRTSSLSSVRLDHLYSLKRVVFEYLGNRELVHGWFKGPESLEAFSATWGKLEKLGDKVFASLTNLKHLSLATNNLKEVSRSILPYPAKHLERLNLEINKIRTLPRDIFSGMPLLTEVDISHNLIHALPEDTWSPVFSKLAGYLIPSPFDNNPLRCDQDLKWACHVNARLFGRTTCAFPEDKRGLSVEEFCEA